jgi:phosphoserine phosphatase
MSQHCTVSNPGYTHGLTRLTFLFPRQGEEVAAMTKAAMGGTTSFREALDNRLMVMQPTQRSVDAFVKENPPKLSPGIKDLFDALRAANKTVYLVSGGFRPMINPVADALDVPRENVFANDILFNEDGSYNTFNANEFTSKAGGKADAVKHIKAKHGHAVMAMVGDGATDLEARVVGGADVFVVRVSHPPHTASLIAHTRLTCSFTISGVRGGASTRKRQKRRGLVHHQVRGLGAGGAAGVDVVGTLWDTSDRTTSRMGKELRERNCVARERS